MLPGRSKAPVARAALALAFALCLALAAPARSCTLFGLAGADVAGGGTLLVKNRDWRPNQTQRIALAAPRGGYRYLGLYADGGGASGLKAGVNEAGLTVITATAASIPREERRAEAGMGGVMRRLLTECGSVAEAVARQDILSQAKPCFYMLSDRSELARVETAPGGHFAVTRVSRGPLFQTNHYLEPSLEGFNRGIGESSRTRAERITQLLEELPKPANLAGLLVLSRDTAGGADSGIWRTGSTPAATRTLATFAVAMPPSGPGRLFVRLADPGAPERSQSIVLDRAAFTKNAP